MRGGPSVGGLPHHLALQVAAVVVSVVDEARARGRGVAARLAGDGALEVAGGAARGRVGGTVRGVNVVVGIVLRKQT